MGVYSLVDSWASREECVSCCDGPSTQILAERGAVPRYWGVLDECWKGYWLGAKGGDITEYAAGLPDRCWARYAGMLRSCATARGYTHAEADDLTQSFLLDLFEHRRLDCYDAERGTLRGFLFLLFKRFVSKHARRNHALKRGGGAVISAYTDEVARGSHNHLLWDRCSPDWLCEQACVETILERAERELQFSLREHPDGTLLCRLIPLIHENGSRCGELARQSHISPAALKMRLCRLRQRYLALLQRQIKAMGMPADELRECLQSVGRRWCFLPFLLGLDLEAFFVI